MEAITIYRVDDGSEFRSADKAAAYENRVARLAVIMARLPQKPSSNDFANGHGYIQHDYDVARAVMNDVLTLIEEVCGPSTQPDHGIDSWIYDTRTKGPLEVSLSWVGRLISDYTDKALNSAWYRFQFIDWNTMREYGQPYYASHPEKAQGGRLNV